MALGNFGKYSQMLQNMPNPNTGTHAGGLSHVLQQALLGYSTGQNQRAEEATQGRYEQMLRAMTGTPDNTITWKQPTRLDGSGDPTTLIPGQAPSIEEAIRIGAGDPGTMPFAAQLAGQNWEAQNAPGKPLTANQTGTFVDLNGNTVFGTYDDALNNGWNELQDPAAVTTVTTAEGVFVLNPDGTIGNRLGSPTGGSNVTVNNNGAPEVGSIPPGYQLMQTPDGGWAMSVIPGGPIDLEMQAAANAGEMSEETNQRTADIVTEDAERALAMVNDSWFIPLTGIGSLGSSIPGTPQHDLDQLLLGMKSNIGFDRIQRMRAESKTGAALGSVQVAELERLEAAFGSLAQSQSKQQFVHNMNRVISIYNEVVHGTGAVSDDGDQPSGGDWSIERIQ